jgi:hypothetical protein
MDFTISTLAAERVADLRRDVPLPWPERPPRRTLLRWPWTTPVRRRLRTALAGAASP